MPLSIPTLRKTQLQRSVNLMLCHILFILHGFTTWTLTKRMERKLAGNIARMSWAVLYISWKQHLTKQQLYGHLPLFSKNTQTRRASHAGHSWRSKDNFLRDILLLIPTHSWAKVGRQARTYLQQLFTDTGCSMEDLSKTMDKWPERVREIHAGGPSWWSYLHIKLLCTNKLINN